MVMAFVGGATTLGAPAVAVASSTGVIVSSVDDYGNGGCNGGADLCNSVANGTGFISSLPSFFSLTAHYQNGIVWDSDFVDPEAGHGGSDHLYFDRPGTAISYFTGHGSDSTCTTQICTSATQCMTPPPESFPGATAACQSDPMDYVPGFGHCCYDSARYLITHGSSASFANSVGYRAWVGFGESANSGGWAGYGTNGGTNAVFLDISWGAMPNFGWAQLGPMFAGMRVVGTVQPVAGDTGNVAQRGASFSAQAAINPLSSVYASWANTLNLLPSNLGNSCSGSGDGGHGINGCGCNLSVAADHNWSAAYTASTANWFDIQDDTKDATGVGYYFWRADCNYNMAGYPWNLP